ncbi:MAG: hypothetical protein AAGI48_02680 [Verrucomicrobiota bacterium]
MKTTAPHTFRVGINHHEHLRKHLRSHRITTGSICLFVTLFGSWIIASSSSLVGESVSAFHLRFGTCWTLAIWFSSLIVVSIIYTWIYMAVFGNRWSRRVVNAFQALVEGPFLRIITIDADKKVHFREIVDYEVSLTTGTMEQGISDITMRTTVAGQSPVILKLPAVENAIETRDLLAEVDAERE